MRFYEIFRGKRERLILNLGVLILNGIDSWVETVESPRFSLLGTCALTTEMLK